MYNTAGNTAIENNGSGGILLLNDGASGLNVGDASINPFATNYDIGESGIVLLM